MSATRKRRLELVDTETGEVVERRERVPHAFDGKGYTLEGHGVEVPNFALNLSGTEWDLIDWMKQHGGSCGPVLLRPAKVAPEVCSSENTVKSAVARLLRLNLFVRIGGPRSGTYQLNPRRFWEGGGEAHVKACAQMDPPPVTPDAKAQGAALKAAVKAVEASSAAAAVASEAAVALPNSPVTEAANQAAKEAVAAAILAVETAVRVGAKLPVHLRRLAQEASK